MMDNLEDVDNIKIVRGEANDAYFESYEDFTVRIAAVCFSNFNIFTQSLACPYYTNSFFFRFTD